MTTTNQSGEVKSAVELVGPALMTSGPCSNPAPTSCAEASAKAAAKSVSG